MSETPPPLRHIFLDMDGVIVDFMTSSLELHGGGHLLETWPPGEKDAHTLLGITRGQFWKKLDAAGAQFWSDLPPYPWTFDLLSLLRRIAPVTILTSPSMSHDCPGGKILWMRKHLGKGFRDYLIGPSKHLLAHPDTLLVDDKESNVEKFRSAGGQAILFPRPWNSNHHELDPLEYVRRQLNVE